MDPALRGCVCFHHTESLIKNMQFSFLAEVLTHSHYDLSNYTTDNCYIVHPM